MTIRPQITVFLSSTVRDLRGERRAVRKTITKDLDFVHDVVCMEEDPVQDQNSLRLCLKRVGECQAYILLVASRYGTRIDREGRLLSFTEHEYDRASELRLPRIRLLSETIRWSECDDEDAIKRFRGKLEREDFCGYFPRYRVLCYRGHRVAARKAKEALEALWSYLDGELYLVASGSYDDYTRSAERVADIREWIAKDVNEVPSSICLFPLSRWGSTHTYFVCLLPRVAARQYVERGEGNWHGGVLLAWRPDEGDSGSHRRLEEFSAATQAATLLIEFSAATQAATLNEDVIRSTNRSGGVVWLLKSGDHTVFEISAFLGESWSSAYKDLAESMDLLVPVNALVSIGIVAKCLAQHTVERVVRRTNEDTEFYIREADSQMSTELGGKHAVKPEVTVNGRHIPTVAFFGTKGGVGKTTLIDKFATLVSRAEKRQNLLLVDFDVHHRGLTILRTKDSFGGATTIHEYLADPSLPFATACDVGPPETAGQEGRQFLIPSSNLAAQKVFSTLAKANPQILVRRINDVLTAAAEEYGIHLILIDCGPIVDPLTASAAFTSDISFIIGQNEPISFQAFQNYSSQIREFFPDFDASNVKVVLNKVRGPILQRASIFAAIPFTMEVVDYSEGLQNLDEIRLTYLDVCIRDMVKSIFEKTNPEFVPKPEAALTVRQRRAFDAIECYPNAHWYRRLRKLAVPFYAGCGLTVVGIAGRLVPRTTVAADSVLAGRAFAVADIIVIIAGIACAAVGGFFFSKLHQANTILRRRRTGGNEVLMRMIQSKGGRKMLDLIQRLSDKTEEEKQ